MVFEANLFLARILLYFYIYFRYYFKKIIPQINRLKSYSISFSAGKEATNRRRGGKLWKRFWKHGKILLKTLFNAIPNLPYLYIVFIIVVLIMII